MSEHGKPEGRHRRSDGAVQYPYPLVVDIDPSLLVDRAVAGGGVKALLGLKARRAQRWSWQQRLVLQRVVIPSVD